MAPTPLWAVVKADGYGHGAVPVAEAALSGGAEGLCVALVEEGVTLRRAGIEAPTLILSEPPPQAMDAVLEHDLTPALYSLEGLEAVAARAEAAGVLRPVHVKVDTGMNRVGIPAASASGFIEAVEANRHVRLDGVFTHFACADELGNPATKHQARSFANVLNTVRAEVRRHCCNSAAALANQHLRMSMVRVGIALYGISPSADVPLPVGVRPALSLKAKASFAKDLDPGQRVSYGHRYEVTERARMLTVPLGYADGVPRSLGARGGQVLVNGRRCLIAGTVTMDQLVIDAGDDASADRGTEVVLLGSQGDQSITAEEWAALTETIGYEIVCRFGQRLPRRYVGGR